MISVSGTGGQAEHPQRPVILPYPYVLDLISKTHLSPVCSGGAFAATAIAGTIPPLWADRHVAPKRDPTSSVRHHHRSPRHVLIPVVVSVVTVRCGGRNGRSHGARFVTVIDDSDVVEAFCFGGQLLFGMVVVASHGIETLADEGRCGATPRTVQVRRSARNLFRTVFFRECM